MNKAVEIILALVIVGATLAFGGVQPLTYSLMEVVLVLAILLLLWKQTREGKIDLRMPLWPGLFLLLVLLQVIPLPSSLVTRLAAMRLAGYDPAALPPGREAWTTISIYPHATLLALMKVLAYFCAFLLAVYVFDSRKRKSTLVRALIYLGVFEAAYGTVQYLTGWQKIFTYTKQYYTDAATGTYINHNHFAGFLELTLPLVMASAFYSLQILTQSRQNGPTPAGPRDRASLGIQALFYLFLMVIMLVGVIFSRSRGGILATLFTIVFIVLLAWLKAKRRTWMLGLFAFLMLAVGYGLWIGLGPVLGRFEEIKQANFLTLEGRVSFWRDSCGLIRDYPVAGIGLGNFGLGFRHYQTSQLTYFVDHAHNDYVEFAAETGFLGVALLFLPILYLLGKMTVAFLKDSRRYRSAICLGCIGSVLALLLHTVTDFNLQIPANALILAVVLGIGYKAACLEPGVEGQQARRLGTR